MHATTASERRTDDTPYSSPTKARLVPRNIHDESEIPENRRDRAISASLHLGQFSLRLQVGQQSLQQRPLASIGHMHRPPLSFCAFHYPKGCLDPARHPRKTSASLSYQGRHIPTVPAHQ